MTYWTAFRIVVVTLALAVVLDLVGVPRLFVAGGIVGAVIGAAIVAGLWLHGRDSLPWPWGPR